MKRFLIWVETSTGKFYRAFTWDGNSLEGIAKAKRDALSAVEYPVYVWATPVANQ